MWREGDEEVNGTEERIDSIAGNDGLICGLSRPRKKEKTVGFMKLKERRMVAIMHGATG